MTLLARSCLPVRSQLFLARQLSTLQAPTLKEVDIVQQQDVPGLFNVQLNRAAQRNTFTLSFWKWDNSAQKNKMQNSYKIKVSQIRTNFPIKNYKISYLKLVLSGKLVPRSIIWQSSPNAGPSSWVPMAHHFALASTWRRVWRWDHLLLLIFGIKRTKFFAKI